ncbi:LysE/ArgO family amino acid transporter [Pseudoroseicyclus tamaricis]|uniref:LysE/ArgO family amino acid transporter n=1 Tax=Pseudoroseicyclus tamaricis TaxID=2705421 RepID=UPI001F1E88ED|nr:LysE/ArgO family amino acid transporter [Pseudoroseicyclus tamaricis]
MLGPALTGFATGLSLILAIGAQNAFVLRQGLMRAHVLPLVLFCALSDAVLIAAGVAGFGAATAALPWLPAAMALAGAGFLIVYGAMRMRAAFGPAEGMAATGGAQSLGRVLAMAAAFTWANPHVYLDTLGLVGAVSLQFEGSERLAYALGAMTASFAFFFSLGYGARALAPVMRSPRAWGLLDATIALVMWAIAGTLLWELWG